MGEVSRGVHTEQLIARVQEADGDSMTGWHSARETVRGFPLGIDGSSATKPRQATGLLPPLA